ncbi:hypothetical protein HYX08_04235 [Candidatus Woesearchaeota archaeon]|nr:hypothetical protein [Candidatus Woesearchaeota archaeon]
MKNSKEIKIIIEKLKHDKDTLQFEIDKFLIYSVTITIGIAAIGVSVIIAVDTLLSKGFAASFYFLLLGILGYIFKNPIKSRTDKLKGINKKIEENYDKLLK